MCATPRLLTAPHELAGEVRVGRVAVRPGAQAGALASERVTVYSERKQRWVVDAHDLELARRRAAVPFLGYTRTYLPSMAGARRLRAVVRRDAPAVRQACP